MKHINCQGEGCICHTGWHVRRSSSNPAGKKNVVAGKVALYYQISRLDDKPYSKFSEKSYQAYADAMNAAGKVPDLSTYADRCRADGRKVNNDFKKKNG